MRGNTLNSTGVYNRCKLTRLVVDSNWDKKVWDDSWQSAEKEKAHMDSLAEQNLLGEELSQGREKRLNDGKRGPSKRRKADNDAGESWGENTIEPNVDKINFLYEQPE